ncbi:AraC family transcriptional regulator [Uliginosibacterium sp. H3]|uniref:AraC family transcriptional regulator n=1 Tax=Uliginosibacterium silvisoli TaxID=3114758 RepID=A0ABU6JZQ8_9RHOO|nr:AraC family transcriptional regulator [Uliginosibacterium sp. H3]
MSINIERQLRQIRRFGTLARYIDTHLDDELTLAHLAEVASISRHRLDSGFHGYADETPMSRVWRLRLLRARQQIIAEPTRPLLEVAIDAGYGSAQAFSRAFRRLHAQMPSAFREQALATRPALRIETLPEMRTQCVPFSGQKVDMKHASDELRARAMACGMERDRRFGWAVNVEANLYAAASVHVDVEASLLHAPLGQKIAGLDEGRIAGGAYAVFRFHNDMPTPSAAVLTARIEEESGWRVKEGPWLRRCRNLQHLPSFLDRRFEIYIPVRAGRGKAAMSVQDFILER